MIAKKTITMMAVMTITLIAMRKMAIGAIRTIIKMAMINLTIKLSDTFSKLF